MDYTLLISSVLGLRQAAVQFETNELSPMGYRNTREELLSSALRAMAAVFNVTLEEPVQVNSNGEFSIFAGNPKGPVRIHGTTGFGDEFAQMLTAHRARTGFPGPNQILGVNGWCFLNHFEAEKMVNAYYDGLISVGKIKASTLI